MIYAKVQNHDMNGSLYSWELKYKFRKCLWNEPSLLQVEAWNSFSKKYCVKIIMMNFLLQSLLAIIGQWSRILSQPKFHMLNMQRFFLYWSFQNKGTNIQNKNVQNFENHIKPLILPYNLESKI